MAKNEFGEATANVNLNIESDPEPEPSGNAPIFIEKPKIKFEEGAGRVIMETLVKSDPKPTAKWSKEGVSIEGTSRVTTTIVKEKEHHYRIKMELRVYDTISCISASDVLFLIPIALDNIFCFIKTFCCSNCRRNNKIIR